VILYKIWLNVVEFSQVGLDQNLVWPVLDQIWKYSVELTPTQIWQYWTESTQTKFDNIRPRRPRPKFRRI